MYKVKLGLAEDGKSDLNALRARVHELEAVAQARSLEAEELSGTTVSVRVSVCVCVCVRVCV